MESWAIAFVIIFAYLVFMLIIGAWSYLKSKKIAPESTEEYFLMGKNIGPFLLFWTTLATMQSTFAFLGATGKFYVEGVGFLVLALSQGVLMATLTYTIGHRLWALGKERNYLTPADFIDDRYRGKDLRMLVGFVQAFFTLFYLAMQFVGSSQAITGITQGHVSYLTALVLIVIVTGVYTALGGMRAVVWTDFVQGVLLLVMSIASVLVIVSKLGGVEVIFTKMLQTNPDYFRIPGPANKYTDINWMMQFLVLPFGLWLGPQIMVRMLAAKDKKSIYASAAAIPISQLWLFGIAAPLLAMAGYITYGSGVKAPDQIVPMLLADYLPIVVGAVLLSGAIAAGMSTVDSMILVISQIIEKDFVAQFRKVDHKTALKLGRLTTFLIVVISFLIAYRPPKLLVNVIIGVTYTAMAQLAPAFILGFYWKRANREGILTGLGAGLVILLITKILNVNPMGIPGFLWAFTINWLLAIVVSLVTNPTPKDVLEQTIERAHQLVYGEKTTP